MRQAGVLAAAGIIALEEMPKRLAEDHDNARLIAEAVSRMPQAIIDVETVQTNIVIFDLKDRGDAMALAARTKLHGLLCSTTGPHTVRLVTHRDVSREDCERAMAILEDEIRH